jgi:alkyl sulfatase BDS1-like metallo-beta-lactamase superfamily hydrolase
MSNDASSAAQQEHHYLPRPDEVTKDYLRDILDQYYIRKWNTNKDTVAAVKKWRDWPLVLRMPDVKEDFTVHIDEGAVTYVRPGLPDRPRILVIMLSETMQRIYYDETTAAIEAIAGRIKIRGNETERRRLLAAISFLTW